MLNAFFGALAFGLAAMIATNAVMVRAKFDQVSHNLMYGAGVAALGCAFSLGVLFERWMA
jgi:hypothetical protein